MRSRAGRRIVIDRTGGARRASRAAGRRGSRPPRRVDVVARCGATRRVPAVEVEQQPGGARVAVARLADAAGVQQPWRPVATSATSSGAARRRRSPARPPGARTSSATWVWPIRPIALGRTRRSTARRAATLRTYSQIGSRGLRVEEADVRGRRGRLERREPGAGTRGSSDLLGPARGERGAAGELVAAAARRVTAEVVVAGQAHGRVLARRGARSRWGRRRSRRGRRGTRSRRAAVAATSREHRLEGVAVAVDVGEDGDLHGAEGEVRR